jgi:hypothetical protein
LAATASQEVARSAPALGAVADSHEVNATLDQGLHQPGSLVAPVQKQHIAAAQTVDLIKAHLALAFGLGANGHVQHQIVARQVQPFDRAGELLIDVCIEDSESFADYHAQLLPWDQCEALLPTYCDRIGIPATAPDFVDGLKQLLTEPAARVDEEFPQHAGDVVIGSSGDPSLRREPAREVPASTIALHAAIQNRTAPRNLLDVLANIEHWTGFTRNFGPQSGDDPKLRNARERYLLTVFAMGCNLGPNQAARHLSKGVTTHQLSYTNQRHMSLDQLDNARRDLTELYLRLELPKLWGEGKKVAADGTQHDFYDQNLLVGMHFRCRRMGAVAYRHVADNYIAVFRHFIPPGVLEAVYVIEGLMKAGLSVQADTVYSDTHGQSETVFAFTHLAGIQLMPRIRNWKDLRFYRPDKSTR